MFFEITTLHCTKVRFASFLSGGFTTMAVINHQKETLCTGPYSSVNLEWMQSMVFSILPKNE